MAWLLAQLSTAGRRARRVVSQRVQAAVLSVALILGAVLPAGGAVAQEPDQGQEGIAVPEQTAPPDSSADPDFDPGGEATLPFEVGPPGVGEDDDSGDGAPVDVEPVADPDAPLVPLDDPAAVTPDAPDGADEPVPPAEVPPAPPAEPTPLAESSPSVPPPAPAPTPPPAPPATTTPQVRADQPQAIDWPAPRRAKRQPVRKRQPDRVRQRSTVGVKSPAAAPPAAPVPTPDPVPATAAVAAPVAVAPTTKPRTRARPGGRTHAVQRGESLWTIASDLLGDGATNAAIAAQSGRLHRLNRDLIGSDPNILITGTVLRLR